MQRTLHPRALQRILLVILGGIAVVAAVKFSALLYHETLGSYDRDVSIYLGVGRGILNGLTPYRDLFETKAPGIFVLSALSLHLFDDATLVLWVEAAALALLPLIILIPLVRVQERSGRVFLLLTGLLFGMFLTLYTGAMAGQGLTESSGAVLATAVVALGALYAERFPRPIVFLTSFVLFLAVFLKEPFLLSALGGVLIVSPSLPSMRRMVLPVLGAGTSFVIALLLMRTLMPYITIYLGHMFGHQISNPWGTVPDPLWLRTINIPRQWAAMHSFSAFLPWVIFPLWIGSLPLLLARASDVRGRSVAFLQWLLGSWLLTLSVGLSGDFYGHHFIFAVPAYCGFFFVCVRERSPPLQSLIGQWGTGMWVALLSLGLLLAPVPSLTIDPGWEQWMTERRSAAATIDAVLDRCGVERYLLLINANDGIHAFTRHSPHGPLFTQYAHFIAGRLAFLEAFGRQFHTAPIVIDKDDEPRPLIDEESLHEFQTAFTEKPPACAGEGFMQPVPYRILFRIGEQT